VSNNLIILFFVLFFILYFFILFSKYQGFDEAGARRALVVSNDNVELAIEILLQINTNQ